MSESIVLYKFAKRTNSTKRATSGTQMSGDFRGPIDIMTPSIDIESSLNDFDYNYLTWYDSINSLQRYYWIRHKVYFPDHIIRLQLEEDVLATFKDEINNEEFFIERSSSIGNELGTDTMPVSINGIGSASSTADVFEHYGDGWYVVGISGANDNMAFASSGGIYYFLCDYGTANDLVDWLNSDGAVGEWADYNPMARVISIKYMPISFDAYKTQSPVSAIIFDHTYDDQGTPVRAYYDWNGYFVMTTGVPGITHDVIYTKSFTMNFSNHLQYSSELKYLNYPPYREVNLYAGAFGKIEVPLDLLSTEDTQNKLGIDVIFDLISGLTRIELYFVRPSSRKLIYSSEDYSMTVDCAISSQSYNKYSDILARDLRKAQNFAETATKAIAGAGSAIIGAELGNPMLAGSGVTLIASAATTQMVGMKEYALDSYKLSIPDVHTKGSNGSFSMIEKPWILYTISHLILPVPPALLGYSCNQINRLSISLGYTKCIAASFKSEKATLEELIAINDYLNNGFYNE